MKARFSIHHYGDDSPLQKAMYSLTVESAYSNWAALKRSLIGWQLSSIHRPSLMLKNQPIDSFNVYRRHSLAKGGSGGIASWARPSPDPRRACLPAARPRAATLSRLPANPPSPPFCKGGNRCPAAVLPIAEYAALLERLEDAEDLAEAREVLKRVEEGRESTIPWDAVKAEYGL